MPDGTRVITVGNFDGVHAGHRALLARARDLAGRLGATRGVTALAFDPHPLSILRPERTPPVLTPFPERAELLRAAGADEVRRLEPTPELLAMTPHEFVAWMDSTLRPVGIVEGPDFRFGRGRSGDLETLRSLCAERNIVVEEVRPVGVGLSDGTVAGASSSIARWLLQHGRVRDAWAVLMRPHRLSGVVVRGERRGRELGFPTANFNTPNLLPADGVYASLATLPDGLVRPGALSVGTKPQFAGASARTAEVHLLGCPPAQPHLPRLPEYGWPIVLDLVGWVREQMAFDSVERLVNQMARDCARVEAMADLVSRPPEPRPAHAPGTSPQKARP
jgi:riboflavin kinase / FMN adenylyltransferase